MSAVPNVIDEPPRAAQTRPENPGPARPDDGPQPAPNPHELLGLIHQRVWLHVRRRKAWLDSLPKQSVEHGSPEFFRDPDDPVAERHWQTEGEGRLWEEPIVQIDARLAGPAGRPLRLLAETFQLTLAELDLLQSCVALHLDPALGQVFACFHGQAQSSFASGPLVKRLFGHSSSTFWHPLANLTRWKLVCIREAAPGEPMPLAPDPMVVPWLEGKLVLDPAIAGFVRRAPVHPPLPSWPMNEAVHVLEQSAFHGMPVRLVVIGPPSSGRSSLVAAAAQQLGVECMVVDTNAIAELDWPDAFLRIQRFAILGRLGVIWTGQNTGRPWPRALQRGVFHALTAEQAESVTMAGWSDCHLELRELAIDEKQALWRQACQKFDQWPEAERTALTESFQLSVGQICSVGRLKPELGGQAIAYAREVTRQQIGNLGQFLPCPFTWEDMILSEELIAALKDLSFEARARAQFWDRRETRRLFPRGTGLTALLSGSPGTGKTMAAQVIAAELKLDLFRIDLARVVSKYIGETAKHLSEIFSRASRMSAILLFDEADALFAKRTQVKDSHDRYANADTSYLLQLLEEFSGLAILTTNKRGNIDPAFYRRLRYVYEFPKPGPEDRLKIWQRLTVELFGQETGKALLPTQKKLAEQMAIAPAQIKATLLATVFIAQRQGRSVQPCDLLKALQREMAKEGRGVDEHVRNGMEQES
jgi:hypothetical protein